MTDKEKQIEEMAKRIRPVLENRTDIGYIPDLDKPIAEELSKYYQPKIPEGSVVLTGKETDEHLEDLLIEFDEMSFYPLTTVPNPDEYSRDYKKRLICAIKQLHKEMLKDCIESNKAVEERVRKETARMFANSFTINLLSSSVVDGFALEDFEFDDEEIRNALNDTLKLFGVEVEE